MKKNSEISKMFAYAGSRHWLTILGMVLAGISTVLSMIPFVCIWFVVRDLLNALAAGDMSLAAHSGAFAWWAVGFTFDHVGFSYEPGKPVLKDVSFTAKQGQVTALVGPSGGGKSTIANLAAGFYPVDSGRITLGGTDIAPIDSTSLMKDFSVVFQNVVLFNNTVMENIRVGRKDATDADVMAAAKAAHCHEFIEKLPNGYQTVIGENGSTLSGGECQRLSIARAL